MENFGVVEAIHNTVEFINLYSQENPIMNEGEICYFLLTNALCYHRPLITKGLIVEDKFADGMNKIYGIKILEIQESPKILKDFVYGNPFTLYPIENNVIYSKRYVQVNPRIDLSKYIVRLPGIFVRNTYEKAVDLRIDYVAEIKKDILKQLKEIEEI